MISAQRLTYIMHILYNINYYSLQWSHARLFYIQIFEKVHFKSKISLIIGLIRFNLSFFDEVFDLSYDISVVNSRFRKSLTWVRSLMLKSEMVKRVVRFGGGEERDQKGRRTIFVQFQTLQACYNQKFRMILCNTVLLDWSFSSIQSIIYYTGITRSNFV